MKPELKYGLITGTGVCVWIIAGRRLGIHSTWFEIGGARGIFCSLIPMLALILLLKRKQEAAADGRLGLGQGIGSGLAASFFSAVLVYCFLVTYNQFINPGWVDDALDWKVSQMRAQGLAEAGIRKEIIFYRQINSPAGLLVTTLVGMTLLGTVLSLVVTLLLRGRSRTPPD
jgi:hypothetical protein